MEVFSISVVVLSGIYCRANFKEAININITSSIFPEMQIQKIPKQLYKFMKLRGQCVTMTPPGRWVGVSLSGLRKNSDFYGIDVQQHWADLTVNNLPRRLVSGGHSCKIGNAPILEANIRFFMFLVF